MKKFTLSTIAVITFSFASAQVSATGTKTGGPSAASYNGGGYNSVVFTGTKTGGPTSTSRFTLSTGTKTGGPTSTSRFTLSTGTKTGGPTSADASPNTGTKTGKPQGLIAQDSGTFSLSAIFSKYFSF